MKNIVAVAALAFAALFLSGCGSMPTFLKKDKPAVAAQAAEEAPPAQPAAEEPEPPSVPPPPPAPKPAAKAEAKPPAAPPTAPKTEMKATLVPNVPSTFKSLQPYKPGEDGTGKGVAYRYTDRTKEDVVKLLRDVKLAKKEMRLSCERWVHQMVEANKELPRFESCEGAASEIEKSADFTVIACRDDMFQKDNWLTVTNSDGTVFWVWHRACLTGEKVLAYKGKPVLSLRCLNVAIPVIKTEMVPVIVNPPPKPKPKPPAGSCRKGEWTLKANAWQLSSPLMPQDLREEIQRNIDLAKGRNGQEAEDLDPFDTDDVSRTYGKQLRERVKMRFPKTGSIEVRYLDIDPETKKLKSTPIGILPMVDGEGSIPLPGDPRSHDAIGTTWSSDFISPEVSGSPSVAGQSAPKFPRLPRLRILKKELLDHDCGELHMHGILP